MLQNTLCLSKDTTTKYTIKNLMLSISTMAGEPESEREHPEPHDLFGAEAGAGAIFFFFQELEHFKKLEWSRS